MIQIFINGVQLKKLDHFEDVVVVHVVTRGIHQIVPRHEAKVIGEYLYDACQRCTGVIMYNSTIIQKEDVKEIKL